MVPTRLSFFEGFRIFDEFGEEQNFPVAKGAALISYLTLSPWDRVDRGELTALLWSEQSETAARTALRQCLYQTKNALKNYDDGLIGITSDSVSINRQRMQCDTDPVFLASPHEISFPRFNPENLLKGLDGLDPAFDDWLRFIRDQCDRKLRTILLGILEDEDAPKKEKLRAAGWMKEIDPAQEKAARTLIEDAAERGDQVELLSVYRGLWRALEDGWEEEPSADLQEFVGDARARFGGVSHDPQATRRKFLTVLSLHLSMGGGTFLEPEEILEPRKSIIAEAKRIVAENEGITLHANDEGLRAVFGLPSAREIDVRNGVEASFALRSLCKDIEAVQGGIGLDAGILIVGGSVQKTNLSVVGLPLEQAIFLSNQSRSFEILVSDHSVRRLQKQYVTTATDFITQDNSGVLQIDGRETPHKPIEGFDTKNEFVGRSSFLTNLTKIWETTSQSSSLRVVNIQGPAGIGKTRLVDEFVKGLRDQGIRTAAAICNRHDRSAPLEPVWSLVASLEASFTTGSKEFSSLRSPTGLPSASEISKRLEDAILEHPTVLFLDDWQWADDATRMMLNRFSVGHRGSALLIILTSRETAHEDQLMEMAHRIILPSFTLLEVEKKAARLLERPLERRIREEMYARSGGNPLLLEEICHELTRPEARRRYTGAANRLPANIHSLIASRIERLALEDLEIVYAAAVHGDQFQPELLSAVLGREVEQSAFQRLFALDIFVSGNPGGTPRFKHGIALEVTYGMIPLQERRRLHLAYANLLLANSDRDEEVALSEILARHFTGGEDRERASHYSEISGDKALAASALDQAMWHYGVTLELMGDSPEGAYIGRWVSVAMRWAIPCIYAASLDHLPVLLRAEALATESGDQRAACLARYWIGYLHFVLGNHPEALESLQAAELMADELGEAAILAEVQAIKGCALGALARYDEAQEFMKIAVAAKARNPSKTNRTPVTSLYTNAHLSMIRADRGEFDAADELFAISFETIEGVEHEVECTILHCSAVTQIWRGNWSAALDLATRARELSDKVSSTYLMGFARSLWGYAHWRVHGGEEGLNTLFRASNFMEEQGMAMYLSLVHGWLAEAFAESGNYTDAREACESAMKRSEMGEVIGAAMAHRAAALCDLEDGQLTAASNQLRMAQNIAELRKSPHEKGGNHLLAARLRLAENRHDDARIELRSAREIFRALGLRHWLDTADEIEQLLA